MFFIKCRREKQVYACRVLRMQSSARLFFTSWTSPGQIRLAAHFLRGIYPHIFIMCEYLIFCNNSLGYYSFLFHHFLCILLYVINNRPPRYDHSFLLCISFKFPEEETSQEINNESQGMIKKTALYRAITVLDC